MYRSNTHVVQSPIAVDSALVSVARGLKARAHYVEMLIFAGPNPRPLGADDAAPFIRQLRSPHDHVARLHAQVARVVADDDGWLAACHQRLVTIPSHLWPGARCSTKRKAELLTKRFWAGRCSLDEIEGAVWAAFWTSNIAFGAASRIEHTLRGERFAPDYNWYGEEGPMRPEAPSDLNAAWK